MRNKKGLLLFTMVFLFSIESLASSCRAAYQHGTSCKGKSSGSAYSFYYCKDGNNKHIADIEYTYSCSGGNPVALYDWNGKSLPLRGGAPDHAREYCTSLCLNQQ